MAVRDEARKRLWARSGNRCAKCREELVRPDEGTVPGALVGQEAHIVARSPGGPRYLSLPVELRDGYENLILLCANDHIEIDVMPVSRYSVEVIQAVKADHEQWVQSRLSPRAGPLDSRAIALRHIRTGEDMWDVLHRVLAYLFTEPDDLTDEEADLIDDALQNFRDCGEISGDLEIQGQRAMRQAKRSLRDEIEALAYAGFVVLGGNAEESIGGGVVGPVAVLRVARPSDLEGFPVTGPDAAGAEPRSGP